MKLDYNSREIFWGNEALIVADMAKGSSGKPEFTNHKIVTGLVSVGSMEDQAETNSYPADDVPDHGVKKGATLLQGEMVFIQTDQALKEDILGQQRTANGLGWSPTGNWKTKCVQYLIKGRKRDKVTGEFVDGYRVVVYPHLTPTAEATKESETDSVDGVDPIQWTLAVQATDSDIYLNGDKKVTAIEYEIWGEQAKDFVKKMESGLFIMQPDTELAGAVTLVAPIIANVQTKTKGHNDGTIVLPATLKNSKGQDVKVSAAIKDVKGNVATNNELAPNVYIVTFSAEGYADVSAGVAVTDMPDGANHVAFAYSEDGKDRFTTVYPNLNLIENGKFAKPISSKWAADGTTISKSDITGYFKVKFNGSSLNRVYYSGGLSTIPIGQTYSVYIKAYSLESSLDINLGSVNGYQNITVTNNSNIPKTYKVEGLVRGDSDTFGIFGKLTTTVGTLFISEIKAEQGLTVTPWMPTASEAIESDYPSYIGTYTDNDSSKQSTDPVRYSWKEI